MKTVYVITLSISLSILLFSLVSPTVSAYTVRSEHPRVFINSDNIDEIRARCSDPNGVQDFYYEKIKYAGDSFIDSISGASPDHMWLYAFLYLMGEIPGYTYDVTYNGETLSFSRRTQTRWLSQTSILRRTSSTGVCPSFFNDKRFLSTRSRRCFSGVDSPRLCQPTTMSLCAQGSVHTNSRQQTLPDL